MYKIAVLTISDRCSRKERDDLSGKIIIDMIEGIQGEIIQYDIIPDELELIIEKLRFYCDDIRADFVFTTGGTGFGLRDVTPEATGQVIEKSIPGIPELMRLEGLKKTRNAMLSRGISGIRKNSIIINLPGSPKGVRESLEAILDIIPHAYDMVKGANHDKEIEQ
ncbi:MAG: MogA/MoaB family molybdenum cofactor biosynthesis protein [Candidatus Latescibacter sp.]|nr:MogA/MoaB family molybdenum cofactor biosynthesis protein [Candidatus Latescibacter sp.]